MLNIFDHQENVYLNLYIPLNYLRLKTDTIKFDKDVKLQELSYTIGGNVKWNNHSWKIEW